MGVSDQANASEIVRHATQRTYPPQEASSTIIFPFHLERSSLREIE